MKIRRFVAKDMRTALTEIKEELGPDAVIMSNKKIPEGVELMAAVDYSQSVPEPVNSRKVATNGNGPETANEDSRQIAEDRVNLGFNLRQITESKVTTSDVSTSSAKSEPQSPVDSLSALLNRQIQQAEANQPQPATSPTQVNEQIVAENSISQQFKSFTDRLQQCQSEHAEDDLAATVVPAHTAAPAMAAGEVNATDFMLMKQEMASIRQLLEHQVSGLMWQDMAQKDPMRALLVDQLTALGLNGHIADQLAGYVPNHLNESQAWQTALEMLAEQVNTTNNDIINRGGVVALVGPTGVGKTTTVAKIAARYAQIHGADNVALISTDTFRIAGFEQLSTYGRIIGCQVKLAENAESLDVLLQQFAKKKLVLIDTAGMGQRDMRLAQHLTDLISNARVRIRNYLVLAANTQQGVMQENVERFKTVPLTGTIFTKIDESLSMGEIISTSIQNGLPIGYLTDGQRVPEDIKVANAKKLVLLAEKLASKALGSKQRNWRTTNNLSSTAV